MSFLKFQDFVTTVWQISSDTKSAFVCRAAALRSSVMKLTWSNAPILSHLCTLPLFPVAPYLNRNLIFKHVRPVCLVLIGSNRLLSWFCFCFLVHSHHILSKICLLAACDLWWLTVFHACNKNSLWDFFFFLLSPFLIRIDACVHSLIRILLVPRSGKKKNIKAQQNRKHRKCMAIKSNQTDSGMVWQPFLTEICYPCCVQKQTAKNINEVRH